MSTCALFTRFSHRFCKLRQNIEVSRCVRKTHKYPHVSSEKASSKFNTIYRDLHGAIEDSTSARDFIYALKQQERTLLLNELQTFENERIKASGGPTVTRPTTAQLKLVALHNMLPFIGFGFLDNFLMITSGEFIEMSLGVRFGISTMFAAAIGNLISDVAGVWTAHHIETVCSKFGVRAPPISPDQVDMKITRYTANSSRAIGICIGCIFGMVPLLFISKDDKKEKDEEEEEKTEEKT